jgi:hypothetical protein
VIATWARRASLALATAAGLGFLARDLLQLPRAVVALAWLAGALAALFGLEPS